METEKLIICEYCNKTITKRNRIRHENSKTCINSKSKKQCKFKDKYYKFSNEIELKNKKYLFIKIKTII